MTDSAPQGPGWIPNPVLARLAFGNGTRDLQDLAGIDGEAEPPWLDLDDPLQRTLGDFELLELIGQGGMGVVYRARQTQLQRDVALKLLSAGAWASEEFVARFQSEAQHAARLQHPNIVTVYEIGEHRGLIYYAMEFVSGISLDRRLQRDGPMSPRAAATLLLHIAEAVDYAHRLGVLHLDLKPGNVLIADDGTAKIADFGLARRLDNDNGIVNDRIFGTPGYLAPEQARTDGVLSPATDVWALGSVLFEMLTGRPPFDDDDPSQAMNRLLHSEVPRPSRFTPVPADLEAICLKCLSRDPADRYTDAGTLADDLRHYLAGRPVSVRALNIAQRTARWMRREPRLAMATGLAITALLIGITATAVQWRRAESNAVAASMRLWESRRDAALRAATDGHGVEATVQLLHNIQEEERAGQRQLAQVDRRRLGMLLGQGAVQIDAIAIADANPLATAVSDDGSRVAIALNDRSVRWYDSATLRELGRVSLADRASSDGQPRSIMLLRFAGNDRLIATLEWYANLVNPPASDSWLIDLTHAAVVAPPAAFTGFADASYSADGRYALLRDRNRRVQLWQTDPWQSRSALFSVDHLGYEAYLPWLVGPGGRFACMLRVAARELVVFDPLEAAPPRSVLFPGDGGISAWGHSHDGRTLALGDFEGRVFLLDLNTLAVRTLPSARGREVTWVAFSEDDRWVAAGRYDGTAYAFDVASGDSLTAGLMQHDFVIQRVDINRAQRTVVVAGEGTAALWRLPETTGPRALPPLRTGAGPAAHGTSGRYPAAWSLRSGLLASAGVDGQVRLWRLPRAAMSPAIAARQLPETIGFDGRHLVDVEWNRLRIVDADGSASTRWIELAQPPGFAELIDGGRTLLATIGPALHIYDARTLQLRAPPIPLPQTPQRLLPTRDGQRVLLSFGARDGNGFLDRLQLYDLRNGRRLPGEALLPGPQRMLAFSDDGRRVLAVGPAQDGATTVLASDGLRVLRDYPHDPFEPVLWGDFRSGSNAVWLVTHANDARLGSDLLIAWDPDTDTVLSQKPTGRTRPIGVIATPRGAFVAGMVQDQVHTGAVVRTVPAVSASTSMSILALSPDGHIVAHASQHGVVLFDAMTGAQIGPPLRSESNALDAIMRLAFSADGQRLLARTLHGRWMVWSIAPEQRSTAQLAADTSRLAVDDEDPQRVRPVPPSVRTALRGRDPGPWLSPTPRPDTPVAASSLIPGEPPVPQRLPGTPATALDLSAVYNRGPDGLRNTYYSIRSQMRPYPAGLQRIAGVDYDLRGMAEIGSDANAGGARRMPCTPVPDAPIAAVHLLMTPVLLAPIADEQPVLSLTLRYRDGGTVQLPLRTGREVPGYAGHDEDVPHAFSVALATTAMGYTGEILVAPRLPNPHPQRLVRCLAVTALTGREPVLVYGITVEPAAPVISTAMSRSQR